MPSLQIFLFGGIQILVDKRPATMAYDKVRALLAFLLIEGHYPQSRETLAGLLWPEQAEKEARHSLSQALLKLRQAIDPNHNLIVADRHTVALTAPAEIELDTAVFTNSLQQCRIHRHPQPELCDSCMSWRETAVALYKGPFLDGLSVADAPQFEQWITHRRERYHRQVVDSLGSLITYHKQRGELGQAIQYAQQQLTFEPWLEETHRQLMMLFARSGQRSLALKQYKQCRAILKQELNMDVTPETKTLSNQIRLRPNFSLQNLPVALTPFIGRDKEMATLASWLEDPVVRLITITGIGGMGKTRLALATAERFLHSTTTQPVAPFGDGIYFIDLVPLTTPDQIETAVAEVLHLQLAAENGRTPKQQLLDYLSNKHMLLIFDNFEHLLAGGSLIRDLLEAAPNLSVLVTSRTQLRLRGEKKLSLAGLDYQHDGLKPGVTNGFNNDASQMFLSTAQQVVPALNFSKDDEVQIGEICSLVEGMPLAVELAARWVDTLPLNTIRTELTNDIAGLETELLDLPSRHRSMEVVFETSWQRLSESARCVLARASVFQGGFTLDAAVTIFEATNQTLSLLVNHSLLRFERMDKRYHCHELVRQFSASKLAVDPDLENQTRQKHLVYYCQLAMKGEQQLRGGDAIRWMKQLGQEKGNWQAAFDWGFDNHLEMAAQMANHLSLFWFSSGQMRLGQKLFERLLDRQKEIPEQVRGWVYTWYTAMIWVQGRLKESKRFSLAAYHIFQKTEDSSGIVMSYHHQSAVSFYEGDLETAVLFGEQALEIARGDTTVPKWFLAICLQGLSVVLSEVGREEAAYRAASECLQLYQDDDNLFTGSYAMSFLARHAIRRGNLAEANALCQQGLALAQDLNDRRMESIHYLVLGNIALAERDFPAAVSHLEIAENISDTTNNFDTLDEATMLLGRDAYPGIGNHELALAALQRWAKISLQLNNEANMAACLENLAKVHWQLNSGNLESPRWLAAAAAWRGITNSADEALPSSKLIETIQKQLSETEFRQSWETGLLLTLQAGLAEAISL